jgi:uncharacterized membrane protein
MRHRTKLLVGVAVLTAFFVGQVVGAYVYLQETSVPEHIALRQKSGNLELMPKNLER